VLQPIDAFNNFVLHLWRQPKESPNVRAIAKRLLLTFVRTLASPCSNHTFAKQLSDREELRLYFDALVRPMECKAKWVGRYNERTIYVLLETPEIDREYAIFFELVSEGTLVSLKETPIEAETPFSRQLRTCIKDLPSSEFPNIFTLVRLIKILHSLSPVESTLINRLNQFHI
jgi:hypothetical protein